jgi:chromosome segregation ATPase
MLLSFSRTFQHLSAQRALDTKQASATRTMQTQGYDDDDQTVTAMTPSPHNKDNIASNSHTGTKHASIRQRMKEQQGSGKLWRSQARTVFASSSSKNSTSGIITEEAEEKKENDDYPSLAIAVTMSNDDGDDDDDENDHDDHTTSDDDDSDAYRTGADVDLDVDHYFTETTPAHSSDDPNNSYLALMGRYCDEKELEAFHAYEQGDLNLLQTSMMSVSPDQKSMHSSPAPPGTATAKTPSRDAKSTPHHVLDAWQGRRIEEPTGFFSPPMPMQMQRSVTVASDEDDDVEYDNIATPGGSSTTLLSRLNNENLDTTASPTPTPFSTFRQNSTHIALSESKTYVFKIAELEEALAASEEKNRVSEKRVHILQSELSALHHRTPLSSNLRTPTTSATPSSMPEAESLWERNKTLVKEVRFADQTCVELSGQKSVMEKEVTLLKEQRDQVRGERESLRDDLNVSRQAAAHAEARCESLQDRLQELESIEKEKAVDTAGQRDEDRIQMEADKKQLKEELKDARDRLEAVCLQLQEIKEGDSNAENASKEKLRVMESKLLDGDFASITLKKGLYEAELKLQSTEAANATLRMELLETKSKLLTSVADSGTIQIESQETEHKLLTADAANETLKMDLRKAENKLVDYGASNGTLKMDLHETERKLQTTQTANEALQMELRETKNKLQASDADCESLETELKDFEWKNKTTLTVSESSERELQETKTKLQVSCAFSESLKMELQETECKLQLAQTANETLEMELEETYSNLQASGASSESVKVELLETTELHAAKAANETLEKELQETAQKLRETETVVRSLKRQLQEDRLRVAQKVKSAVSTMQQRSDVWQERVATQTDDFAVRLCQLTKTVSLITESFVFEEEYEHSFLTEDSEDDDIIPEVDASESARSLGEHSETTQMNVTLNVGCNESKDLELMEEARSHESKELSPVKITAAVAETDFAGADDEVPRSIDDVDSDTMSSIAGISHLFSYGDTFSSRSAAEAMAEQMPGTESSEPLFQPDELQESQIQIQELLAQNAEIVKGRDTLYLTVERLEERLAKMDADLLSSTSALEQVSCDRDSLQERLATLQLEKANTETELEITASALKGAYALCKEHETSSSTDLKRVSDERDSLGVQLESLQLEKAEAEAALEAKTSSVQAETQELYRQIEDSSSALEEVSNERDSLLEQVQLQLNTTAEVEAEMDELAYSVEAEARVISKKIEDSSSTLDQVSNERDTLLEQLQSLQLEKVEAEAKLEATVSSVHADTQELSRKIEDSSSNLELVSNERDALRGQLESLQLEKTEVEAELQAKLSSVQAETQELYSNIQDSSSTLEQVSIERDSLLEHLESLELEQSELKTELKGKTAALEVAKELCVKLEMYSSSSLQQVSTERDLLRTKVETLELEQAKLETELETYREDEESLQQQKAELETELESKISALHDAEQNSLSIQHDETEIARLQHALDTSEDALEQLEIAFVECNDKLANYESVNADNQALVEEYQKTQRATEDLASNAESRWLETQNQLEQIRIERDILEKDRASTMERLNQYTEEMNEKKILAEVQLREKENALQAAVVEKELVLTASNEYKTQVDILQGELRNYGDVGALVAEREAEIRSVTDSLQKTKQKLSMVEKQLLDANDALSRKGGEATQLLARKENVERKLSRMREYINKLTAKCDQWESYYGEQSRVVEGLRDAITRTRQKAKDIAMRYQQRDQVRTPGDS